MGLCDSNPCCVATSENPEAGAALDYLQPPEVGVDRAAVQKNWSSYPGPVLFPCRTNFGVGIVACSDPMLVILCVLGY